MSQEKLGVGIVGACGRGSGFVSAITDSPRATLAAVCDVNADALARTRAETGAQRAFDDYEAMLDSGAVDAVVIATPMPLHVPQSIAALERGVHVLSEVPAGVSVEACRRLVETEHRSTATYAMAENYIFSRSNMIVGEIARRGLFGEPYFADGEYLHDVKHLATQTPWRRHWQLGIHGVTYPTHSLGPILDWMPEQRVTHVCCSGAGSRHRADDGKLFENEAAEIMLGRLSGGGLVKLRVDLTSDRPHAMHNYQLQGTDGCYESARAPGERDRVWLRDRDNGRKPGERRWLALDDLADEFLPECWRNPPEAALQSGHGGGDYLVMRDFLDAVLDATPPRCGIHRAMDSTLPGLVSQDSAARNGLWLPVPDSRHWIDPERAPTPQLQMLWPPDRYPDLPELHSDYLLRPFRDDDGPDYLALMTRAGFEGWDAARLEHVRREIIPSGFFVVEHKPTGRVVATAQAQHKPKDDHPEGGEMAWVAADPDHRGQRLGHAVVAAATRRLLDAGYRRVYLLTDDHRLPALSVYLKMGWQPRLTDQTMRDRWEQVSRQLDAARHA